ncbi:hypothetical protein M9458_019580, partial [Cirrhinus mrigala]
YSNLFREPPHRANTCLLPPIYRRVLPTHLAKPVHRPVGSTHLTLRAAPIKATWILPVRRLKPPLPASRAPDQAHQITLFPIHLPIFPASLAAPAGGIMDPWSLSPKHAAPLSVGRAYQPDAASCSRQSSVSFPDRTPYNML